VESGVDAYAAIKQDGRVYTLQKVTWIDDILNHPLYRPLLQAVYDYNNWSKNKLVDIVNKKLNEVLDTFNKQKTISDFLTQAGKVVNQEIKTTQSAALQASLTSIDQIKGAFPEFSEYFKKFDNPAIIKELSENEIDPLIKSLKTIFDNIENIQETSIKSQFTNAFALVKPIFEILKIKATQTQKKLIVGNNDFLKNIPEYVRLRAEIDKFEKNVATNSNGSLNDIIKQFLIPLGNTAPLQGLAVDIFESLLKSGSFSDVENGKYIKTGLVRLKDGKMEIFVCVDAIQAEITPENRKKFACPVKGETLGSLTETLLKMKSAENQYEVKSHIITLPGSSVAAVPPSTKGLPAVAAVPLATGPGQIKQVDSRGVVAAAQPPKGGSGVRARTRTRTQPRRWKTKRHGGGRRGARSTSIRRRRQSRRS
jgi:hypothetical protein